MEQELSNAGADRHANPCLMLKLTLAILAVALLAACGRQSAPDTRIDSFTYRGHDTHDHWFISWEVTGPAPAYLNGEAVPANASQVVHLTEPTTFTLQADAATESFQLAPMPELQIVEFAATTHTGDVEAGDVLQVNWDVEGAQSLQIIEVVTGDERRTALELDLMTGSRDLLLPADKREVNYLLQARSPFGAELSQPLFGESLTLSGWVCNDPLDVITFEDEFIEREVRSIYGGFIGDTEEILCGHVRLEGDPDWFTPLPDPVTGQELHHAIIANRCDQDPAEADPLIESLEGIQHLIYLRRLELECNELSDISRLASLTWLEELNLDRNEISDLAPLAAMSNLRVLGLYENRVSDLTPLRGLESLEIAYLSGNRISDVSPLAGLDQLRHLWLYLNCQDVEYDADGDVVSRADCLADISTLDGMSQLESLIFHMNDVADISAISRESMPALEVVFATGNLITDVSTLAGLPVLRSAFIDSNFIDSIEPFVLNTDFPAGAPWSFARGTVSMPPADWATFHLTLGENCLDLSSAEVLEHLDTLADRGVSIAGIGAQRPPCPTGLATASVNDGPRDSPELLDAFNDFRRAR